MNAWGPSFASWRQLLPLRQYFSTVHRCACEPSNPLHGRCNAHCCSTADRSRCVGCAAGRRTPPAATISATAVAAGAAIAAAVAHAVTRVAARAPHAGQADAAAAAAAEGHVRAADGAWAVCRGGPRVGVVLAWRWRPTWWRCVWPSARLQTFVSILIVTVFTHLFTAKGRVVGSVLGAPEPAHMLY